MATDTNVEIFDACWRPSITKASRGGAVRTSMTMSRSTTGTCPATAPTGARRPSAACLSRRSPGPSERGARLRARSGRRPGRGAHPHVLQGRRAGPGGRGPQCSHDDLPGRQDRLCASTSTEPRRSQMRASIRSSATPPAPRPPRSPTLRPWDSHRKHQGRGGRADRAGRPPLVPPGRPGHCASKRPPCPAERARGLASAGLNLLHPKPSGGPSGLPPAGAMSPLAVDPPVLWAARLRLRSAVQAPRASARRCCSWLNCGGSSARDCPSTARPRRSSSR